MNMKKGASILFFAVLAGVLLMLWGCPKKTEVSSSPEQAHSEAEAIKRAEEQKAAEAAAAAKEAEDAMIRERAAREADGLKPVYFDFDRAAIRDDAKVTLRANADWLQSHPTANIVIEGNCDERGTVEYNQALGQRRALSAKKYLVLLGVSPSRISLLSYGKEKPLCTVSNEDCWQKNRRGDFIVAIGK